MKKLAISLAIVVMMVGGSSSYSFACGHQHAERCLADTTTTTSKQTEETKVTYDLSIYRTALLLLRLPW